jgi:predicted Zn-dependent protease
MACVYCLPGVVGCAAAPTRLPAADRVDADRARVAGVVARLTPALRDRTIAVTLEPTPRVAAYAWPDGRLLLTRGLVRLLDEDELAAAVAHELGHLLADGHLRTAAALSGSGPQRDAEVQADAAGRALLTSAGYAPYAMADMLEKVAASPGMSNDCRARLRDRINRLRAG